MASEERSAETRINMASIARAAGVSRPAVTNWRRRYDDFPAPVEENGVASLFRAEEVFAWMDAHGKKRVARSAEQELWAAFDASRSHARVEDAAQVAMTMLGAVAMAYRPESAAKVLQRIADSTPAELPELLEDLADRFADESDPDQLLVGGLFSVQQWMDHGSLLRITASAALEFGTPDTFEALVAATARGGRSGAEYSSPEGIARLITKLVPVHGTVVDFACGRGTFLLTAARAADARGVQLIGQDVNTTASALTRLRLAVHGFPAQVSAGDTLTTDTFPELRADLVLMDPPFSLRWNPEDDTDPSRWLFVDPSPKTADTAWIQHAISRLKPDGRAAVITVNGPLFRGGTEAELRRRLLRAGCIEMIVTLPPGLYASTNIPVALWILRAPQEAAAPDVILVDASTITEGRRGRAVLTDQDIERIDTVRLRLLVGEETIEEHGVGAIKVPVSRLLTTGKMLFPARLIEERANPAEVAECVQRGQRHLSGVPAALQSASTRRSLAVEPVPGTAPPAGRTVKVTELADLMGTVAVPTDIRGTGTTPLIGPLDVQTDLSLSPGSTVDLDLLPAVELTQPGDVVVRVDGRTSAAVDAIGGAVVAGPSLRILRPKPGAVEPSVLAALITYLGRRQSGGVIQTNLDLKDVEIPVIPAETARDLQESLTELFEKRRLLADAVKVADDVAEALVVGLGDGLVQFRHDAATLDQP